MRLDEIQDGDTVVLERYDPAMCPERKRRFEDLGLFPGTRVSRRQKAPFGDPLAFLVRGTILCLRREEACLIWVKSAS